MDTIKQLAEQRHFYTAELALVSYGRVILIGDESAVRRLRELVEEHHELVELPRDE